MKILIATGIYPPKTSGPAQYAYNMEIQWRKSGHKVMVKTYGIENRLPTGVRHIYYFLKILPSVIFADYVFILDTYSTGFPAVLASKLFGKKSVIRTGGDFLWEGYVERTGVLVCLKDFYLTSRLKFNLKEKVIFEITKWTLNNVKILVFSTEWQRNIFIGPYGLDESKTMVVENHYEKSNFFTNETDPKNKNFVAGVRPLKWKNLDMLRNVFSDNDVATSGAKLDEKGEAHEKFLEKIRDSYAVILVSLGDISPHMIIDALSLGKPFILTKENGILNRVSDYAILVDPKNKDDIREKILWLMNTENYESQVKKVRSFSFVRTWEEISIQYIEIFKKMS